MVISLSTHSSYPSPPTLRRSRNPFLPACLYLLKVPGEEPVLKPRAPGIPSHSDFGTYVDGFRRGGLLNGNQDEVMALG